MKSSQRKAMFARMKATRTEKALLFAVHHPKLSRAVIRATEGATIGMGVTGAVVGAPLAVGTVPFATTALITEEAGRRALNKTVDAYHRQYVRARHQGMTEARARKFADQSVIKRQRYIRQSTGL